MFMFLRILPLIGLSSGMRRHLMLRVTYPRTAALSGVMSRYVLDRSLFSISTALSRRKRSVSDS